MREARHSSFEISTIEEGWKNKFRCFDVSDLNCNNPLTTNYD